MGASTTHESLLSEATVAAFERDGFFVIPDLITHDELDRHGRLVTEAVADRTALDGSTRGYPFPHVSVDRSGIQVGEAIDGDATPVVWPRAAGDLPPVPTVGFDVLPVVANTGATPRRTGS